MILNKSLFEKLVCSHCTSFYLIGYYLDAHHNVESGQSYLSIDTVGETDWQQTLALSPIYLELSFTKRLIFSFGSWRYHCYYQSCGATNSTAVIHILGLISKYLCVIYNIQH